MHSLSNENIDRVLNGTDSSQTLRFYSTQPIWDLSNWKDFRINAFGGNDKLVGAHGDDELFAGAGNDTIQSFYGYNDIDGGSGDDTLDYSWFGDYTEQNVTLGVNASLAREDSFALNSSVRFDDEFSSIENLVGSDLKDKLYGDGAANDISGLDSSDYIAGGAGADFLEGGNGNDTVIGGTGSDDVYGDGGDDLLIGSAGNDRLVGGTGDDDLRGGLGSDSLTGGTGIDYFQFLSIDDSNVFDGIDRVRDFREDVDKIDLSYIDANEDAVGNQSFDFIDTDPFSRIGGGEVRYRVSGNTTVIQGDTNGDGTADFTINVSGIVDFLRGDFIL